MLPKPQRLRDRRDFRLVYSRGRSYVNPALVLYVRKRNGCGQRIGFSISKKLGDATDRNRIKRRLREATRARMASLQPGFDAIFVGRSRLREAAFAEVQRAVDELFRRAKLFAEPDAPEEPTCGDSAVG